MFRFSLSAIASMVSTFLIFTHVCVVESFDIKSLQQYVKVSSLSYLSMEEMCKSPYLKECGYRPLHQVVDPITESGATIFVSLTNEQEDPPSLLSSTPKKQQEERQKIAVACRGSATPRNFVTNLQFNFVDATVGYPSTTTTTTTSSSFSSKGSKVHSGFQKASYGLWEQLESEIKILEKEMAGNVDITFTGHSLGGATALLCAAHHATSSIMNENNGGNKSSDNDNNNDTAQKDKLTKNGAPIVASNVVTFGGPRLCNNILASHLSNNILKECNILHLVHDQDPILVNNQQLWDSMGFHIAGQEVQCDPYNPIVYRTTCGDADDEGENNVDSQSKRLSSPLSSLFGAWNILDHCNYLGTYVGPRFLK